MAVSGTWSKNSSRSRAASVPIDPVLGDAIKACRAHRASCYRQGSIDLSRDRLIFSWVSKRPASIVARRYAERPID